MGTEKTNKKFLYKELSFKIIGLCIEIQKEYGENHDERIYHRVLQEKLEKEKINYLSKPKVKIFSQETGKILGYYEPDFIIQDQLVLELKARTASINADEKQLMQYLKTTEYEIGYVINFGIKPLYFKRIIYSNNRKMLNDNSNTNR